MATYDLREGSPSSINPGDILNCPYSGGIISVTLPAGTYKLECWGAKGSAVTYVDGETTMACRGGNGGYSCGDYKITSSTTLYLVSGGHGNMCSGHDKVAAGGYNGGGQTNAVGTGAQKSIETAMWSGGGATHIAKRTGLLSTLSSYQSDVLLVAGGGGGGPANPNTKYDTLVGGNGGGTNGKPGKTDVMTASGTISASAGGNQSNGGSGAEAAVLTTRTYYGYTGTFGQGGKGNDTMHEFRVAVVTKWQGYHGCGGGGGGWYGGGGGAADFSETASGYLTANVCAGAAAGGSGYVSSVLSNTTNTDESVSTNPDSENQHGYIRITVLEFPESIVYVNPYATIGLVLWKEGTVYVKVNGVWKKASVKVKVNGTWH